MLDELEWVIERAEEHLGEERAGRYLRKFYPWYAERLDLTRRELAELVEAPGTGAVRALLAGHAERRPAALAA